MKSLSGELKRIIKRDIESALQEDDFNMVVRRAQESVELILKGALKILGIEYPKIHDVGMLFSEVVQRKIGDVNISKLGKIVHISTLLCEDRAPAFYGERSYGKEEAEESY